jgi:DNA-binding NarL/FixJ family response regulator
MAARAIVVDDHAAFRSSARRLLELAGYDVVGEAGDGSSGLALARELEPELVLLDIALPDMSGFDVAEALAGGRSAVVLVSSRTAADLGKRATRSGARGFIPKDRLSEDALRELVEDGR